MDAEVDRAAVAGVLDLADVLELIEDRLDERAFAQQEPVGELEELIAHVLAQFGDEAQPWARKSRSASGAEMEPLSPKSRPKNRRTRRGTGRRSSVLPGVRQKASNSPRSLTTRWSLNP